MVLPEPLDPRRCHREPGWIFQVIEERTWRSPYFTPTSFSSASGSPASSSFFRDGEDDALLSGLEDEEDETKLTVVEELDSTGTSPFRPVCTRAPCPSPTTATWLTQSGIGSCARRPKRSRGAARVWKVSRSEVRVGLVDASTPVNGSSISSSSGRGCRHTALTILAFLVCPFDKAIAGRSNNEVNPNLSRSSSSRSSSGDMGSFGPGSFIVWRSVILSSSRTAPYLALKS